MAELYQEILADSPKRFYRLADNGLIAVDHGSDGINLAIGGDPLRMQTGGIPSRPDEHCFFYDGGTDCHIGQGTGVGSDAGGGSAKAFAMMLVVKVDSSAIINEWIFSEGSSLSTTPLFGLNLSNSTGRLKASIRDADNTTHDLVSTVGIDIRNAWKLLHWEQDPTDATTGNRLYIDGTLNVAEAPSSYGATATVFDRIAIGGLYRTTVPTSTVTIPGWTQYAAIFNHALGQTRITAHWNAFNASPDYTPGSPIKPLRKS